MITKACEYNTFTQVQDHPSSKEEVFNKKFNINTARHELATHDRRIENYTILGSFSLGGAASLVITSLALAAIGVSFVVPPVAVIALALSGITFLALSLFESRKALELSSRIDAFETN